MKRDMDLIREILLRIEADDGLNGALRALCGSDLDFEGRDEAEFSYNVGMLIEAGILTGNTERSAMGVVVVGGLTWTGHEFLDTIRDSDVWRKTKATASRVGGASVALMWELAKAEMKTKLGLP